MYKLRFKGQFKKDLKKIKKRLIDDFNAIGIFLKLLEKGGFKAIPPKNKPHMLSGNYKGHYEAHVKPDLLLIWLEYDDVLIVEMVNAGSHSDLF